MNGINLFNKQGNPKYLRQEYFLNHDDYLMARDHPEPAFYFFGFSEGLGLLRCTLYDDSGDSEGFGREEECIFGYLDESEQMIIPFQFQVAASFSCGLARVEIRGKEKCFIDKTGQIVIQTDYTELNSFSEGLACFYQDKKTKGYLNRNGETEILLPEYILCSGDFNEGLASVTWIRDEKEYNGYLNKHSDLFPVDADYCGTFSEGLSVIYKNGKYGYLNTRLEIIIPPVFASAGDFKGGKAEVFSDTHYGTIDRKGNWIQKIKLVISV